MIERLNFYDIYGYLLPGLTFLGLIWLPFGLVSQHWPPAELSSALVALVVGYITGHILQGLATKAIPSTRKDRRGEPRYPSDILLDDGDETFSREVKGRLADRILEHFGIDVSDAGNPDPKSRERRRQDAFFLCRRALMRQGIASYAEQFEGMYALMRGLAAACGLSFFYDLGWALAGFFSASLGPVVVYILVAGLLLLAVLQRSTKAFWLAGVVLLLLGAQLGSRKMVDLMSHFFLVPAYFELQTSLMLFAICLASLFVALRCYDAYQQFASLFAETVYRDFCAL